MTGRRARTRWLPPPDVDLAFDHDATAPSRARRALEPMFPNDGRVADDVALVASEFVSNVIQHTHNGGALRAWNADPVRLEVDDIDPTMPTQREAGGADGGRGLRIVDQVAAAWGADADEAGKTLWAEFARDDT